MLKVLYNYYASFVNRFLEFFKFNFQKAYFSGIFGALYNYKTRVAIMRVTRISACSFLKPTTSNMKIEKLLENVAKMAKRDKEVIFSLAEILAKKNS